MLQNYLKIAWRNLKKDFVFSSINIFGLAMGLATCLLIALFVMDELGYDKYNKNGDRIFRIISDIHVNGNGINGNYAPAPMGPSLLRDYPQIEKVVRIRSVGVWNMPVKKGNETIMESNCVMADSTLFEVFTLPLISGDPKTALVEPYSMVISESMARKYFNSDDVVGKTLVTNDTNTYKITGVMQDMPAQSHIHFNFIKSMSERKFNYNHAWLNPFSATYILTRSGVSQKDMDKLLEQTVTKYIGPQMQEDMHSSLSDLAKNGDYFRYYTMPLNRIHLYSNVLAEFEPNSNIQYVYIFIIIACFILVIACINFMTLSTAQSAHRSREVGVRKVLGSLRTELVSQFLVESMLISFIALLLAVVLAICLLPYFNQLSGKHITIFLFFKQWMIPCMLLMVFIVGLFAGSYPAFYLSGFQPIKVLKGSLSIGFKKSWFRNSLVVFQFSVAVVLMICTMVIYSQLDYIRNKEIGYNRDQILTISNTNSLGKEINSFKNDIQGLPGVLGVTMTSSLPNKPNYGSRGYFKEITAKASETILLESWTIDTNYIPTLEMKIIKGRNFSSKMGTDYQGVLINETAARLLGYGIDPINKAVYTGSDSSQQFHILGVVKDFNASSLRDEIKPIVFHLGEDRSAISIRVNMNNLPNLIMQIKNRYSSSELMTGKPFAFTFMDDDFNKLYESDQRNGKIILSFSLFAIIISCMGLFGLITYAAEQRTKEIGIRKVLGASVNTIIRLLSIDFIKLIIAAMLIAFPLAWWVSHLWLQGFVYRINISWWIFLLSGLCTLCISFLTIAYQAIKVSVINPVDSLRIE